jgi:hypothetical protein
MMDGSKDKSRGKVRGLRGRAILKPAEGLKVNIGVKVDATLWRRLRVLAIQRGKRSYELLDAAIEGYLGKHGG